MTELFSRAKEKLGVVSGAVLRLPSQNSVDILRNEVSETSAQIAHLLNPSPLAHVMGETVGAVDDFVGRSASKSKLVAATVNKATEWKTKHLRQGVERARAWRDRLGELDQAFLDVRDRYLIRFMEAKAGTFIPEPIERIFC